MRSLEPGGKGPALRTIELGSAAISTQFEEEDEDDSDDSVGCKHASLSGCGSHHSPYSLVGYCWRLQE